jgi:hypothetical protein
MKKLLAYRTTRETRVSSHNRRMLWVSLLCGLLIEGILVFVYRICALGILLIGHGLIGIVIDEVHLI